MSVLQSIFKSNSTMLFHGRQRTQLRPYLRRLCVGFDGVESVPVLLEQVMDALEGECTLRGEWWEGRAVVESSENAEIQELVVRQHEILEDSLL